MASAGSSESTSARDEVARGQSKPWFTIAICTRNRSAQLAQAAQSVLEQMDDRTELLIVDNGSSDDTRAVVTALASRHAGVRLVTEAGVGIARARNAALTQARGSYVLFLDDDELAEPGWLAAYAKFLEGLSSAAKERFGGVGGPYVAQPEVPPPDWLDPNFGGFDFGGEVRVLGDKLTLAGGNCLYPKTVVLRFGGFSQGLARYEDAELNLRLRGAGLDIWWLPSAKVRHLISADRFQLNTQTRLAFAEGRAVTLVRLKARAGWADRAWFGLGRFVGQSLLLPFQLVTAGCCWMLGRKRVAFRVFSRACRGAGLVRELLAQL